MRSQLPRPPRRILVINVARIGDTLLAVPVLRALRQAFPDAELTYLGHPKRIEVAAALPYVDHWGGISKRSAVLRGHFGKRYDLALVYGQDWALVDYALRAAHHVVALKSGKPARDRRLFATVEKAQGHHAVHDRLRWLDAIGIKAGPLRLDYQVTAEERRWAEGWLAEHVGPGTPLVGFQAASFPAKAYRDWPLDNFRALGGHVLDAYPEARLMVFGGKDDRAAAGTLAASLGTRACSVAGEFSLRQTAALLQRLDLYVGVDTGPTHLAGALGIPMVALYHCLHRGRLLAPLDHPAYLGVVEHPAEDDATNAQRSMAEIDVATVWAQVRQALAAGRAQP